MARYGQAYKERVVARLLPPESAALDVVSREVGVSVATLEAGGHRRSLMERVVAVGSAGRRRRGWKR